MSYSYRSFTMMVAAFVVAFGAVLSFASYWFISGELVRETSGLTRHVVESYLAGLQNTDQLLSPSAREGAEDADNIDSAQADPAAAMAAADVRKVTGAELEAVFQVYGIRGLRVINSDGEIRLSYADAEVRRMLQGDDRKSFDRVIQNGKLLTDKAGSELKLWIPLSSSSGTVIGIAEVSKDWSSQQTKVLGISLTIVFLMMLCMLLLFLGLRQLFLRSSRIIESQKTELSAMLVRLRHSYDESLQALSSALDSRDNETQGHSLRVAAYAWLLGKQMGLKGQELEMLYRGALLHDVGKIGIPDAVLRKEGPLDPMEWAIMRTHVNMGVRMLEHIEFLRPALDVVRCHHERWDGLGYPEGLKGTAIPLSARIFAVCDTYDAITSDRPYRSAKSHRTAIEELLRFAGSQFCPDVVTAFLRLPEATLSQVRELSGQDINHLSLEEILLSVG